MHRDTRSVRPYIDEYGSDFAGDKEVGPGKSDFVYLIPFSIQARLSIIQCMIPGMYLYDHRRNRRSTCV